MHRSRANDERHVVDRRRSAEAFGDVVQRKRRRFDRRGLAREASQPARHVDEGRRHAEFFRETIAERAHAERLGGVVPRVEDDDVRARAPRRRCDAALRRRSACRVRVRAASSSERESAPAPVQMPQRLRHAVARRTVWRRACPRNSAARVAGSLGDDTRGNVALAAYADVDRLVAKKARRRLEPEARARAARCSRAPDACRAEDAPSRRRRRA